MLELTSKEFDTAINADTPVVVKYWMNGCSPCQLLGPVMEKVASEVQGIAFFAVSVDNYPGLAQRAKLRGAPTVIMYKNGEEVARFAGPLNEQGVIDFLNKNGYK